MSTQAWHIYRLDDGRLTGQCVWVDDTDADLLAANTPEGCGAVTGVIDWEAQRVDLETLQVVDWQPPAPADDALRTWSWDADARRWLPVPTTAAVAAAVRAERDRLLSACDWVVLRATELGTAVPSSWAAYRQALRDVSDQPGFPGAVVWPDLPTD